MSDWTEKNPLKISDLESIETPLDWADTYLELEQFDLSEGDRSRKMDFDQLYAQLMDEHTGKDDPHSQYQLTSEKGTSGGYASLNSNGKIPEDELPSIAITNTYVFADITERDDHSAEEGDVAIVEDATDDSDVDDGGQTYVYDGSSWKRLRVPESDVTSVNGSTGAVELGASDVNAYSQSEIDDKLSNDDNWDTAYDRSPTGVSVSGDGNSSVTITVNRENNTDVDDTQDFSHTHDTDEVYTTDENGNSLSIDNRRAINNSGFDSNTFEENMETLWNDNVVGADFSNPDTDNENRLKIALSRENRDSDITATINLEDVLNIVSEIT